MTDELQRIVSAIEAVTGISAKWSGGKARVANPITGSQDRNIVISDGETRVRITDFANGTDPKDILEAVGLHLTDLFYEQLTPQQRNNNQRKKSLSQIEEECVFAYSVLMQIPAMKANSVVFSDKDKKSIIKARKMLKANDFTDDDYQRIEHEREIDVKHRDFVLRGGQYE